EAWLLVETSAAELIRQTTGAASSMPGPLRLKDSLVRTKVLSFEQEQVFEHLRRLRNEAVHALDAEFSQNAVSSYIRAAVTMAAYLEVMS
ncbi:MAG TPA: hypothetical protein VN028_07425, partial [Rhodocyclaceae bacterium]|nr:hypothetical protein [Rhodocyclaceae bacterium]